jgi:adenylate cyclase
VGVTKEIERKFLVEDLSNLRNLPFYDIRQGYFEHKRLRERVSNLKAEYFLTIKKGSGISRDEDEKRISKREFNRDWEKTSSRLRKRRYLIEFGKYTIELDVFKGKLKGLVLAEVEFKTMTQARHFTPPTWFGREVTDDPTYNNRNLAVFGLKFLRREKGGAA